MLRKILAVFFGVLVASFTTFVVQSLGHLVWPPPPGMDPNDPASIATHIQQMPVGALLAVPAAWGAGALTGSAFATSVGRSPRGVLAGIVCLVQALSGVAMLLMIPHPVWLGVVGMLSFPVGALIGHFVARAMIGDVTASES